MISIKKFFNDNKKINLIFLFITFIVILIGAIVFSFHGGNRVKSLDEIDFYDVAKNLVTYGKFAHTNLPDKEMFDPSIPEGHLRMTSYRAPGYIFFIAPFVKLKANYLFLRIINFVLVFFTFIILYLILNKQYSINAGRTICILTILFPVSLYTASTLYPQTLQAFLLVLVFYLLSKTNKKNNILIYIFIGITSGFLVLTVPINLLLLPIFILWLFFSKRAKFINIIVVCLIIFLVIGSWTLRNYIVFKSFIPVATSAGFNLAYGNNENTKYNTSLNISLRKSIYEEVKNKNEIERNKIFTNEAVRFIKENPGRFIILYFQKFLHWFHFKNKLISDEFIEGGAMSMPVLIRSIVLFFTYIPFLILLIIRLCLLKKVKITNLEILMLLIYVGAGFAYALFFTRIRFRMPYDWLLLTLNAIFIAKIIDKFLIKFKKSNQ